MPQTLERTLKNWTVAVPPMQVALPAWMPRMAFAPEGQAPRGDVYVCIFQRGAMDGLNALVPIGDSDYYRNRKTLAIAQPKAGDAKSAIQLTNLFGLHPALKALKPIYDEGLLAPIHACGSPSATRSHFDAMDNMERGVPDSKSLGTGWLGRHLATINTSNTSPLRAIGMGTMLQASLRGPVSATVLRSITDFHVQAPQQQVAQIQQALSALYALPDVDSTMTSAASDINKTSELLTKINVAGYTPDNGAKYPERSDFALGMMQIAQLIKADVGLEVACIDIGGWDTHINQGGAEGQMARLLVELGDTLGAFRIDLGDRMKTTLVQTMSEFGRRVEENASGGTDHGHANAMFLMGGGVVGGKVHGTWPTLAADKLDNGDLALTTDYRDILGEIISKRLHNNALDQIFPSYTPTMRGIAKA